MISLRNRRAFITRCTAAGLTPLLVSCTSESDPEQNASEQNTPAGLGRPTNTPEQLAGRTLGLVATEPANGDFGTDVIQRILDSRATSTSLSVYWDDIEPNPGVYAPEPNYFAIAQLFYPPFGISITHSFSVIDTTNKRLPADLEGRSFDDVEVINRFKSMLNWAATQMPDVHLHVISIGNEVDVYLNAHPDEWDAWVNFYTETSAHARLLWPNAVIGSKVTYSGLQRSNAELLALNQLADAVFVTYYAIDDNFNVVSPDLLESVFEEIVTLAAGKSVRILEHGCPSSSQLGSSEELQADFITASFTAWDNYASSITHVEFFALHDFDPNVVSELENYYGLSDPRFAAYLGTLGLRTFSGQGVDKQGWLRFQQETSVR